ncbi:hypothetical protein, partial [Micrococcus sp. KRD070]|uniref:hypothetical protein n=1 Tax=Micrococcus sp. KRD070 TaxID=2729719 RepID=UPI0019D04424
APAATPSPVADLESVRAAIRAHGGPLASTAHVCGRPAPTPSAADAPRGLRGAARTLTATRRDVAARLADSRERADVPVEALLNSAFVDAHADERPADRGVPRGRLAGLVDAVLPPARHADDDAAAGLLLALREPVREVFASDSFAARPYADAPTVRALFEDFLAHPRRHDPERFWRLLNLELWLRDAVDADAAPAGPATASRYAFGDRTWMERRRLTDPHERPLSIYEVHLGSWRPGLDYRDLPADAMPQDAPWHFSVSEKIVAITQGRSYYTWEVRPSVAARVLSRLVTRTPAGIGLGDPTTMQLAIQEAGLPRIVLSAAAGAAGKVAGKRGVFYNVVGGNVRAIDGPTTYSTFPANVSAKLPPAEPDRVAAEVSAMIRAADIPAWAKASFAGTVVMDANDIGRNALGKDTAASAAVLEAAFADNPLGQGRERTPLAVVVRMD